MERCTDIQGNKRPNVTNSEMALKLSAYENSGLSPADLSELQQMFCSGHIGDFAKLGLEKARVHASQLVVYYELRDKDKKDMIAEIAALRVANDALKKKK